MSTLVVFAVTLVVAVLISELADRSVLSTAVLFLLAGFIAGDHVLGLADFNPTDSVVEILATLALFSILFTDGMHAGFSELRKAWHLPGRALLLGMPLAFLLMTALAHWLVGFGWVESALLGAILAPTDPVFAAALVGREDIPKPLQRLLNVESGVNDGLALPFVIVLLAVASNQHFKPIAVTTEVVAGIVLGTAIPWIAIRLHQSKYFGASDKYQPLFAFAIGLLVFSVCHAIHANEFLAAFAAGVTVMTIGPNVRESFHRFGKLIAELLKLAALLVFGSLISIHFFAEIAWTGYLFAACVLLLVRPITLALSLLGSSLPWRERAVAAWFGPKGFASVVYAILVLHRDIAGASQIFHLASLVIIGSIFLHSTTDVPIARMYTSDSDSGR